MADFQYQITLTYEPQGKYYIAYMNEVKVVGTGSTYLNALNACCAAGTASGLPDSASHLPLSYNG